MKKYPLVLIEWEDSAQPVANWSWLDGSDWNQLVLCRSVGWLIHDGDTVKALAPNVGAYPGDGDDDKQISGVIRIPASAVRGIKTLAE